LRDDPDSDDAPILAEGGGTKKPAKKPRRRFNGFS
jgi:hypothetical protein